MYTPVHKDPPPGTRRWKMARPQVIGQRSTYHFYEWREDSQQMFKISRGDGPASHVQLAGNTLSAGS
jgi:hypothetical protein